MANERPSKQDLQRWLNGFGAVANKKDRKLSDYVAVYNRATPQILSEAVSQGVITPSLQMKYLQQFQQMTRELNAPMLDNENKQVTFKSPVSDKTHVLRRIDWLNDDGRLDPTQTFEQVANKRSAKMRETTRVGEQVRKENETPWDMGNDIYRGFKQMGEDVSEGGKTFARKAKDGSAWKELESGINLSQASRKADWLGGLQGPLYKPDEAAVNRLLSTAYRKPKDNYESVGYMADKMATQLAWQFAPPGLLATAGKWGQKALQALPYVGGAGAALDVVTKNPLYNAVLSPEAAMRHVIPNERLNKAANEQFESAAGQAPLIEPLANAAALITAYTQVGAKQVVQGVGNNNTLKTTVNEVKNAIKANQSAEVIKQGTEKLRPFSNLRILDKSISQVPSAARARQGLTMGAINLAPYTVGTVAHSIRPRTEADPGGYDQPGLEGLFSGIAWSLSDFAPPRTIMQRFNKYVETSGMSSNIKAELTRAEMLRRQQIFKESPLLTHLTSKVGLSPDEALVYVSHRHAENGNMLPDGNIKEIKDLSDIANLRESKEIEAGLEPTIDPNVIEVIKHPEFNKGFNPITRPIVLHENTSGNLKNITSFGIEQRVNKFTELANKAAYKGESAAPEAVKVNAEEKKQNIGYPSMVIDTADGPRQLVLHPDLTHAALIPDLEYPTAANVAAGVHEVSPNYLPRENLLAGIAKFNSKNMVQDSSWNSDAPDGGQYRYTITGFGHGGFMIRRNLVGAPPGKTEFEFLAGKQWIERNAPEYMREKLIKKLDDTSEGFGIISNDKNVSIAYSEDKYDPADRSLFPYDIFIGSSGRPGSKGVIPARLIHQDGNFNTYQIPTGDVRRIPRGIDVVGRDQKPLPPIDVRERNYAGMSYADDVVGQLRDNKESDFYDITLDVNDPTKTRRVFVNARDRQTIVELYQEYLHNIDVALSEGKDVNVVRKQANIDITKELLKLSKTSKDENGEYRFNYGYDDTPIHVGDIVGFVSPLRENGSVNPSRIQHAGHERGVVVDMDHNGIHVRLAGELPGGAYAKEGRTVLSHPDYLLPIAQPHLGETMSSMSPSKVPNLWKLRDADNTPFDVPGVIKPTTNAVEPAPLASQEVSADINITATANAVEEYNTAKVASIHGGEPETIANTHEKINQVVNDLTLTPTQIKDGITSILNAPDVDLNVKESLITAVLTFDVDQLDSVSHYVKFNSYIESIADYASGQKADINYIADSSLTSEGVQPPQTRAQKKIQETTVNQLSQSVLANWTSGSLEARVKRVLKQNGFTPDSPAFSEMTRLVTVRSQAMASVPLPLRTILRGLNATNNKIWSYIARLDPATQLAVQKQLTGLINDPASSYSQGAASATQLEAFVRSVKINPDTNNGAVTTVGSAVKRLTASEYTQSIDALIAEKRAQIVAGTKAKAKEVASNPATNIHDLNEAIKLISSDRGAVQEVFKSLEQANLTESQFIDYFGRLRFPNKNFTVGDVAEAIDKGTLSDFVDAHNEIRSTALSLTQTHATVSDLTAYAMSAFNMPETEVNKLANELDAAYQSVMSKEGVDPTDAQQEASMQVALVFGDAISAQVKRLAKEADAGISLQKAREVMRQVNKDRYRNLNPDSVKLLKQAIDGLKAEKDTTSEYGEVISEQEVTQQRVTVNDLYADLAFMNLLDGEPNVRMSQDELDSLRQQMAEEATWLNETGERLNIDKAAVRLPLTTIDGRHPLSAVPPKNTNEGIKSGVSYDDGAVTITRERARSKDGVVRQFKRALIGTDKISNPELARLVDHMAEVYADVWDMHAHSYASRHADYEAKTGNVPDAQKFYTTLLEIAKNVAPSEKHVNAIDEVIAKIKAGEPLTITAATNERGVSLIRDAFDNINDGAWGRKLGAWIYGHRVAQLTHEFYTQNGSLWLSAANPKSFEVISPIRSNYGSIVAQNAGGSASNRAAINLLVHLNRTSNYGRNTLSLGHELHHGIFHTWSMIDKLKFAQAVLTKFSGFDMAIAKATDKTKFSQVKQAIIDVNNALTNHQNEIARLSKDIADASSVSERIKAQEALDLYKYKTEIDMHDDTGHFLYRNAFLNEAVVSTLMSMSANAPHVYDDGIMSQHTTGLLGYMGEFLRTAVQFVNRNAGNQVKVNDWRVDNKNLNHRWTVPYSHFTAHTPLTSDQTLVHHTPLPIGSTLTIMGQKASQLGAVQLYRDAGQLNVATGDKLRPHSFTETTAPAELSGMPRISFEVGSAMVEMPLGGPKDPKPTLTLVENGQTKHWFALDVNDAGIPEMRVNGKDVKNQDIAYIVRPSTVGDTSKPSYVIKARSLEGIPDARVTSNGGNVTPAVASLLYSMWGRSTSSQRAMIGGADKAQMDAFKKMLALSGADINNLPDVNLNSFDKASPEYGTTHQSIAFKRAQLRVNEQLSGASYSVLNAINDSVQSLPPNERPKVLQQVSAGIDSFRRTLFGLNDADQPIVSRSENGDLLMPTNFMSNEGFNVGGASPMYILTPHTVETGRASKDIIRLYESMQGVRSAITDISNAFSMSESAVAVALSKSLQNLMHLPLNQDPLNVFKEHLKFNGLDDVAAQEVVNNIETIAYQQNENPLTLLHDLATFGSGALDYTDFFNKSDIQHEYLLGAIDNVLNAEAPHPHIANQRAIVASAINVYHGLVNKSSTPIPLHEIATQLNNPFSEASHAVTTIAHSIARDIANRNTAIKTAEQYELTDVVWLDSKLKNSTPYAILRYKGRPFGLSQDLGEPISQRTGKVKEDQYRYIAVQQGNADNVRQVYPVVDVNSNRKWLFDANNSRGAGGIEHIRREDVGLYKSKHIEQDRLFANVTGKDGTVKQIPHTTYRKDDVNDLLSSLPIANNYSGQLIYSAIKNMQSSKNDQAITIQVMLPHKYGVGSDGGYSPFDKFVHFDDVVKAMEKTTDRDNVVMRNLSLKKSENGSITITDVGMYGNESQVRNVRFGNAINDVFGHQRIFTTPEVYIARYLLNKAKIQHDDPDFSQPTVFDLEKPKLGKSLSIDNNDWKGSSVFTSEGFDPFELVSSLTQPIQQTPEQAAEQGKNQDFNIVEDGTVPDGQTEVDVDNTGIYQVRTGKLAKTADAWNRIKAGIGFFNSMARVIKLGRDMGVTANQTWSIANPVSTLQYLLSGRGIGPQLYAMSAIPAMLPNITSPKLLHLLKQDSYIGTDGTQFGEQWVHSRMQSAFDRIPELTPELAQHLGLNLDYFGWMNNHYETQLQNPNATKFDTPLNYRLHDYYGTNDLAGKIMPTHTAIERANVLYRDLAMLYEFQDKYLQIKDMIPDKNSPAWFRESLLSDQADAINLLVGRQTGSFSDNPWLAEGQEALSGLIISSRYRKARTVVNPVTGRMLLAGKELANKATNALWKTDIANTDIERKRFSQPKNGGWDESVQKYVDRKWMTGLFANAALRWATRMPFIIQGLNSVFNGDTDKWKMVVDDLLPWDGMVKMDIFGKHYQMPMAGGMGRDVRALRKVVRPTPTDVGGYGKYLLDQWITNQMSPMVSQIVEYSTGRNYFGESAWESDKGYSEWIKRIPFLRDIAPKQLSRFLVNALTNVSASDNLRDIEYKSRFNYYLGNGNQAFDEDVATDPFKFLLNFSGWGAKEYSPYFDEVLNQTVDGEKRYEMNKASARNTPTQSGFSLMRDDPSKIFFGGNE